MIVDAAHYVEGKRQAENGHVKDLEHIAHCARNLDGFVWVGMHDPSEEEMDAVARRFDLHELAVEDAHNAHQRPKLETFDDVRFVVLHTTAYDDEREEIDFGEIHMFLSADYAIVIRHGKPGDLSAARACLEERPDLAKHGPVAVLWAVLDKVVDDYSPVLDGLEQDIEELEEEVFVSPDDPSQRIYRLKRQVLRFFRAVHPLLVPLDELEKGNRPEVPEPMMSFFRDVSDHVKRIDEELTGQRELLTSILQANLARVQTQQNDAVRKISGWAAIIAVPTLVASVYGMNFEHMPELKFKYGYLMAIGMMIALAATVYWYLRRVKWL